MTSTAEAWGTAIVLGLILVGIVVAIAKFSDLWRQRRAERALLRGAVTDALMRSERLVGLTLVPRVRLPFWRGTPARVIVSGAVRTTEEQALARTTAHEAARSVRQDYALEDRMTVGSKRRRAA